MAVVSSLFLNPATGPLKSQPSLDLVAIGVPFVHLLEPTCSTGRLQLTDQLMRRLLEMCLKAAGFLDDQIF